MNNIDSLSENELNLLMAKLEGYHAEVLDDEVWLTPTPSTANRDCFYSPTGSGTRILGVQYMPTRDWHRCGELMFAERISLNYNDGMCIAKHPKADAAISESPLVAIVKTFLYYKTSNESN